MTGPPARNPGAISGPSFAPGQHAALDAFKLAVQRAAVDRRLSDSAKIVHAIVWDWLSPREARKLDLPELARTLDLHLSTVHRALDLLVAAGYLGEGDRVGRDRTFRRAA
jgi:hypothetical protein